MPEVCEVYLTTLYPKTKLLGTYITNINILGGRYSKKPLKGLKDFKKTFPYKIVNIDSKGFNCYHLK